MPPKKGRVVNYQRRKYGRKADLRTAYNKLAGRVATLQKNHRALIENKQIYVSNVLTLPIDDETTFQFMNGLAQGVADTGTGSTTATGARIGNSISVKTIQAKFLFDDIMTSPTVPNPQAKSVGMYRIVIYNSPCGKQLDPEKILRDNSTAQLALTSTYQISVDTGEMYDIWYDKMFCLSDANPCKMINFVKKWKDGYKVIYDDNAVMASNFNPQVAIFSFKNQSTNRLNYHIKVRYEDL